MKSKMILTIGLLAIVVGVATTGIAIQSVQAASAIHIEKDGCGMGDGNGDVAFFPDAKVRQVEAQSTNNNIVYVCTADVPNDSGHAVIYDTQNNPVEPGLKCGSAFFVHETTDWQETISASGNAKLICHFKS
jgi:hypothetical protein